MMNKYSFGNRYRSWLGEPWYNIGKESPLHDDQEFVRLTIRRERAVTAKRYRKIKFQAMNVVVIFERLCRYIARVL